MPGRLEFPLYALAHLETSKTVFRGVPGDRRLLLFTTAENASRYRSALQLTASVVKLKEPRDLRILMSIQTEEPGFGVEIDPPEQD
jgi:hypothetical protein